MTKKKCISILLIFSISYVLSGCALAEGIVEGMTDIIPKVGEMFQDIFSDSADELAEIIDGEELWPTEPEAPEHEDAPTVSEMIESGELKEPDELLDGTESEAELRDKSRMRRYSYLHLSKSGRKLYKDIYMVLANQTEAVKLEVLDEDEIDKVFELVINDHPEFFYVTGYSINKFMVNDVVTSIEFEGTYDRDADEVAALRPVIDEYVEQCISNMLQTDNDYDKVRYIYEYLVDNTEYDLEAEDNQNIISVFKNGKSVCQGYAKATQYLLHELKIPCILITGQVEDRGAHAWNIAYVDGEWTYIDTTWGDASYRNITTGDTWNEINYDYLCTSSEELEKTHRPESRIELPQAVAIHSSSGL